MVVTYDDPGNTLTFSLNYANAGFVDAVEDIVNAMDLVGAVLPAGGATNQLLMKQSGTDFDVIWNDLPAGWFVPAGGTTDQVLKKVDGTDYNTEWADDEGALGALDDLTDVALSSPTIGDVLVRGPSAWTNVPLSTVLTTEPFRVLFTSEGNVALLSDGRIATGAN